MANLLQIVQFGDQDGDTITWRAATEYVVPASNRSRILDREASRGIHPGEDGWLTFPWHVCIIGGVDVTVWTRIRWQPFGAPEMAVQDLDGGASIWPAGSLFISPAMSSRLVPVAESLGVA